MTTWYMDYQNGTDANASAGNGDSFATRRKRIDNFVAAAIAPGDTIRIMASPDPTSIGNGTWTDGPNPANKSPTSSTNASPIVVTISSHGYANGDTVIINNHSINTNANGVWTVANVTTNTFELKNADGSNSTGNGVGAGTGNCKRITSSVVTLATACTQNIAECGNSGVKANWTASTNVTCSKSTGDYKEGLACQSIAIAAGFTTGLAAYVATGTLNLSGYQQVSFWIKQTAGTIGAAGATRIRLCTDTAGATPVHDCNVPALGALNQWVPVVVDLATNLNSAIQSVSFDVVTDNGAQTFLIDNIIACKAASSNDSLNLTSLISKNSGSEAWFCIQSINGTRIVMDSGGNSAIPTTSSVGRGYSGTTETVTTYKRETIKTVAASSSSATVQEAKDAGSAGSLIAYSGGWNSTDMSTQTGETWFDGQNGFGRGLLSQGINNYNSIDKINFTRYSNGINWQSTDCTIGSMYCCNTTGVPIDFSSGTRLTATTLSAVCCGGPITPGTAAVVTTIARADSTTSGNGVTLGAGSWTGTITQANNNTGDGVASGVASYIGVIEKANYNGSQSGYATANYSVCGYLVANSNAAAAIKALATVNWKILGGSTTGNLFGVNMSSGNGVLRNFTINESTELANFTAYNNGRVYSEKHDGTAGNNRVFCDGGLIATDSGVTHGTASYSWKFSPTSTNCSQYYPLNLPIAQVAVGASALVTVSAWFRRSNTGLTAKLVCKGGQIAGVTSDVTASMTAIADTWEQLTITFTPSEAGVVEIEAQFWGGTTYNGYVCDASISQA